MLVVCFFTLVVQNLLAGSRREAAELLTDALRILRNKSAAMVPRLEEDIFCDLQTWADDVFCVVIDLHLSRTRAQHRAIAASIEDCGILCVYVVCEVAIFFCVTGAQPELSFFPARSCRSSCKIDQDSLCIRNYFECPACCFHIGFNDGIYSLC